MSVSVKQAAKAQQNFAKPQKPSRLRQRLILGTSFAASAFIGGYRGYVRRAYAACTGAGGTYACSGVVTTTQTLSGTPLSITTAPGFSINTVAGDAFSLTGTGGGLTFTDSNASTITGAINGIYAHNTGAGATSITTTGTVTTTVAGNSVNAAIFVKDSASSGGMTINAVNVNGVHVTGIEVAHFGNGPVSVTATGAVTAGTGDGIFVDNEGAGTLTVTSSGSATGRDIGIAAFTGTYAGGDLIIHATDASGHFDGIFAGQRGTGAITDITATGTVTATTGYGIYAKNYSGSGALTIHAVNVNGYYKGIYAKNYGSGATAITVTGTVTITGPSTGTGYVGIWAKNLSGSGSLTINAANVNGANRGIYAYQQGSGPLSITTTGTVTGNNGVGIFAENDSADTNSASTVTVVGSSNVSGTTAGIELLSLTGRDATVTNAGTIAGTIGILVDSGSATIANTGTITGTGGTAIDLTAATSASTVAQQGGTITGAILLSSHADHVDITGGTISGNIVGQGAADIAFAAGAGGFVFAAPYTISGASSLIMNSGTVEIDGTITAGALTVNAGTMTLTGANSFSGGTTLNGGILSVSSDANLGATSGGLTFNGGTLENSAAFTSSRNVTINSGGGTLQTDANLTLSGVISGSGALTKLGTGTLILTGNETYIGNTTIAGGVLQLGSGGTSGSLAATAVTNNGALVFDRSDISTFAGTISGTGSLSQIGTGSTILTGNNTYTGSTTIAAGTLQLGNGGASGSLAAAAVTDNGALVFNRSDTLTFAGVISGTGSLSQVGSGSTILTGNNTYTGSTTIAAGTLQLGNGGTSGSLAAAAVTDNGALIFNRSDTLTFAGTISGTGSLSQVGSGSTILTGNNTYTGSTTIATGTLQLGNGGTSGSLAAATVTDNGVLIFNRSDTSTFAGTISGTGSLSQVGSGSTILTGNNTYTGSTTIAAGTLQLGNGGTSGSLAATAVTDNGVLAFNRSDASTFAGTISGTGRVSQTGAGTTTLSGSNSFTGGTTITAGTLVGTATSFGTGAIQDNAALVVDQPVAAVFANAISGTGSFTKQGAGRVNYTGTATLTGPTWIAAGLLSVNGSLSGSAVTVQNGASLGGNGTVGATTVQSGGAIAPGNSIGTLHINGAFVQNTGSIYQVEVDPNSNSSDLIQVNGAATLQSGAGLNVIKYVPGNYQLGTVYKVLTAGGGLTGSYTVSGQTANVSGFLGLKDSYDANNAYLTVVETVPLTSVATTPNQEAVASAVESLPPVANPSTGTSTPNPVQTAVLNLPDAPAAQSALDQLAGVTQAAAKGAMISNSLYVRDVSFDRLHDVACAPDNSKDNLHAGCASDRPAIWAQGFGGWGGLAGNANAAGVNHSTAGMLVGVDVPVFDWRLGVFGGFSHADFHLVGANADGGSDDYHLGLYGGTRWDAFALRLGASYSWDGITTNRAVAFGTFTDQLRASYNAGTTQAFAELGYSMDDLPGVALEPFANLAYVNLGTGGFTEAGGPAALTVKSGRLENGVTTLGVRPSTTVALDGFDVTLRGMMGWRHIFGTIDPSSTVSFAAGGDAFAVTGAPTARDVAALEAGLDIGLFENVRAGLTYGGQFSNRSTEQQARGTIRFNF